MSHKNHKTRSNIVGSNNHDDSLPLRHKRPNKVINAICPLSWVGENHQLKGDMLEASTWWRKSKIRKPITFNDKNLEGMETPHDDIIVIVA